MRSIVLGDYELFATLGRGGMAEVYLAVRRGPEGFTKLVVIKRLRADVAAGADAAHYRRLLLDEARLAARLAHPNIVQIFEVVDRGAHPFIAMEYLAGQTVAQVVAAARRADVALPVELAIGVAIDVLAALEHVHALTDFDGTPLGVVHRDVSPQNIFWTYSGDVKLMDFGVAKFALGNVATAAGVVKGKLTYMAPEQARGAVLDARADLFALGIVLWELVSGRRLLRADSDAASLQRLLYEPLPALDEACPGVDPRLARVVGRALEREPARRYASASEMRAELEAIVGARRPRREDLAAFVRPLFDEVRRNTAARIRAALGDGEATAATAATAAARPSAPELVPAGLAALPGEPASAPESVTTLAGRARQVPAAERARARRSRPWAIGAGIAAIVAAAGFVGWRAIDRGRERGDVADRGGAEAGAIDRAAAAGTPTAALVAGARPPAGPGAAPVPAAAPALRLCGSNTIGAELAPALVEAFLERKGASHVTRRGGVDAEETILSADVDGAPLTVEIRAHGSATAFAGLAAGDCDVGMASRPVSDAEAATLARAGLGDVRSPATEHVIALDGIAVIVHPNNPLRALDRAALHQIFAGQVTDWAQVGGAPGPITVLARDDQSGTFDTFKHLVLGGDPLVATAHRYAKSDALADAVAGDPSAIGFIGLAYVRAARALEVGDPGAAPMLPTSFTVTTEDYMLSRRLFFYTAPQPRTPLVAELVSYVLSPTGQGEVARAGFVDLTVSLVDAPPCDARCPRAYAARIARARRLSLDFRFRSGSDEIDSRAVRDLDRVVQLLRSYPDARLLLFGFSDGAGDPAVNARLSAARADTIARALATRGVHAAAALGFGAARPVASNATEAERQRNRRVEVWLEPGATRP